VPTGRVCANACRRLGMRARPAESPFALVSYRGSSTRSVVAASKCRRSPQLSRQFYNEESQSRSLARWTVSSGMSMDRGSHFRTHEVRGAILLGDQSSGDVDSGRSPALCNFRPDRAAGGRP
jgi:hypothetical protein